MSRYDLAVIGSGPAGLHAAIEAARMGRRVAVVEKQRDLGGACVHRGTIPSKTLRQAAVELSRLRRSGLARPLDEQTEVATLMGRLERVVQGHVAYMTDQVEGAGVEAIAGRARFVGPHRLEIQRVRDQPRYLEAEHVMIAVGSRPRHPPEIPIDHENVLDSDSILSMVYLPESLTILGGGVIASEWASTFAELGVEVTMIDQASRPLGFMDPELTEAFVRSFEDAGGRYLAKETVAAVAFDGVSHVEARLALGAVVRSRKLLCALGRVANLDGLGVDALGLEVTRRGHLAVDEHGRTSLPHIYAVGDVIGFPALAATSMEQGRRAVRHAFGRGGDLRTDLVPVGIFTIPELASVGVGEDGATEPFVVGRAPFDQVARGHIAGAQGGLLKLLVAQGSGRALGVHVVGDGATELVGIGQMAIASGATAETLVETIFNFPTLAEAYRIAALDALRQLETTAAAA